MFSWRTQSYNDVQFRLSAFTMRNIQSASKAASCTVTTSAGSEMARKWFNAETGCGIWPSDQNSVFLRHLDDDDFPLDFRVDVDDVDEEAAAVFK